MTDVAPGEYWGSDYLLQAQNGYRRADHKRAGQRRVSGPRSAVSLDRECGTI